MDRDRDALLCDLAQYYHIYRIDALPAADMARLAVGLPPESRIMCLFAGRRASLEILLLAETVDLLRLIAWFQTKDGKRNRNRPERITPHFLTAEQKHAESDVQLFDSAEAFEAARGKINSQSKQASPADTRITD